MWGGTVLAAADWWARGLALFSASVAIPTLGWNIYAWRTTNRERVKVTSRLHHGGSGAGYSVLLEVKNRGDLPVTVKNIDRRVKRPRQLQRSWRKLLPLPFEGSDPDLQWEHQLGEQPIISGGTAVFNVVEPADNPYIRARRGAWRYEVTTERRTHRGPTHSVRVR